MRAFQCTAATRVPSSRHVEIIPRFDYGNTTSGVGHVSNRGIEFIYCMDFFFFFHYKRIRYVVKSEGKKLKKRHYYNRPRNTRFTHAVARYGCFLILVYFIIRKENLKQNRDMDYRRFSTQPCLS